MEFVCPEDAIKGFTHWQDVKQQVLLELSQRRDSAATELERKTVTDRISQVETFNAREMLMYDLIELDPRTKDVLEPVFGKSRDGDGYYDAQGVLELKTKPTDPRTVMVNRNVVLQVLFDKAATYGIDLRSYPSFHVNISFWDDKGNLFDDSHPDFSTKGKALTEGITKAFYDGIFILLRKHEMKSDRLMSLGLTVDRQGWIRYSSGRVEVRSSIDGNLQDQGMLTTTLLAGALYGLSNQEKKDVIPAVEVISPVVHHVKDQYKVTSHILNNSLIHEDGSVEVPNEYIKEHVDSLEYELGLRDSPPDKSYVSALFKFFGTSSDYLPFVKQFFNASRAVRTDDGQLMIQFPTTSEGTYEFIIPAINMDKIPPELQMRLEQGEDREGMRSEISQYIKGGDRMPKPAQKCSIDTKKLTDSLIVVGVHSKFIIEGYDLNTLSGVRRIPDSWTSSAWARYQRLVGSECLQQAYSPEFFSELCVLAKETCKSEPTLDSIPVEPSGIKEQLFFKIKDRDWQVETKDKWIRDHWIDNGWQEGKDFIRRSIQIKFEGITNRNSFVEGLSDILDGINEILPFSYWYKIEDHAYVGGTYDIDLEIEPAFLLHLRKVVKEQDRS